MKNRIPKILLEAFYDFSGMLHINKERANFRSSIVLIEEFRENWIHLTCTRPELVEEFQELVMEFNSLANKFLKEENDEDKGIESDDS